MNILRKRSSGGAADSGTLAQARTKSTLRFGIAEGAASSTVSTMGDHVIVPFGLFLKASSFQIGLLFAVPNLMAALLQLFSPAFISLVGSRKRALQICALLSGLAWIGVLLVPMLFDSFRVWWLLGFAILAVVFFNLPNAAWGSWISDLVPTIKRGSYLGIRGSISNLVAAGTFLFSGFVLDRFHNTLLTGFAIVFAIMAAARFISSVFFTVMSEPPMEKSKVKVPNLFQFLGGVPGSNLGRFMMYSAGLYFAVNLYSAFFPVYVLQELNYGYITYVGLVIIVPLATTVAMPFWGPFADRRGNVIVLKIGAWLMPFIPVLWALSDNIIYLILVQAFGGFIWGGVTICSLNFVYESSTAENRTTNIAYFYVLNGIALFLGATISGIIAPHLPLVFRSGVLALFLMSGAVRLLMAIALIPGLKETRKTVQEPLVEKT